ncbi:MAG TPA: response regulator transcription factor [Acidimicrobiia bacterium]|nr:response regulator transcription factor [Acidimicrobiia bacterium]
MPESSTPSHGVRVLVVEDEPLFRRGVAAALAGVGTVDDTGFGHEAVKLAAEFALVVVGTPADMPRVELARRLTRHPTPPRVVVLVEARHPEEVGALRALDVAGLVGRATGPDALALAVGRVLAGERAVDAALTESVPRTGTPAGEFALTARERDVLVLLAEGRSNREIAATLFVSLPTVKTHLAHIYAKLDVKNRNEALGRAVGLGLLS